MLDFFRRYQRYFFLVITVVIIISFSFFGTYNTLGSSAWREQVAFKAVDGQEVTRPEVDEMAIFLATDNEDKMLYGGAWGPNFLNDGVIRKDFLETGLASELALAYESDLREEMSKRFAKEKKYQLYSHPGAPFLSVENVWAYLSPEMNQTFRSLRSAEDPLNPDAFQNRIKLYLNEKKVPASTVSYFLRYQEKQFNWLKPDERLPQTDFSLFGYHTLEDWFSPHFTRLVSEFIINAAILAEKQGYEVSKAEALADLVRNTQTSYQQNLNNPNLGVTSPEQYMNEQLRRLNMDQGRAVKLWRQVLLFRRYFHDAGSTALVDTLVANRLHQFGDQSATVDLYRLPSSLRFADYQDLQNLEIYLQAVAEQSKIDPLALPKNYLAVSEVARSYPQLVQKRYLLDVAQVDQKDLQARIGLRELWNWEIDGHHWSLLTKEFPALADQKGETREERFQALESLDEATRSALDTFAKQTLIKIHPEWVEESLNEAKPEKMVVGIRLQGGKTPFSGLDHLNERLALMRLLDEAPLGEEVKKGSPLYDFTADQKTYYRITVLEKAKEKEILTFAEAKSDGTLSTIRDHLLEDYYVSIRDKNPSLYQKANNEWLPFKDVRDLVANEYFEKVILALEPIHQNLPNQQEGRTWSRNLAASLRFYPHLYKIKGELEKNSSEGAAWIQPSAEEQSLSLAGHPAIEDQWKIEKVTKTLSRQNPEKKIDLKEVFALNAESWSPLKASFHDGDLLFYQVKNHGESSQDLSLIAGHVRAAQALLGSEAQRHLMRQVLAEIKSKDAISLAYLQIPIEEPQSQPDIVDPGY